MIRDKQNKSLGICAGASRITFVTLIKGGEKNYVLESVKSIDHKGNPKKVIEDYFSNEYENIPVAITGRKFKDLINAPGVPEPEAIESAFNSLGLTGKYDTLASLGGENFIVYSIDVNGHIRTVYTGNKCASGTGEFFLQQIGRMDLNVEQAVNLSSDSKPYFVSGRCSVFCKSDCTHALNKGVPKPQVVAGLSKMIADKAIELISKQKSENVLLIGGVSKNNSVVNHIKERYPNTDVLEQSDYFEAFGAGICGFVKGKVVDKENIFKSESHTFTFLPLLNESDNKVQFHSIKKGIPVEDDECILGLDVGSTTTKAVLIRIKDNAILASEYLRTNGNPVAASIECYKSIKNQLSDGFPMGEFGNDKSIKVNIIGLGTTGSGRHISGLHSLTKGVVNEIIAHSVAAAYFDEDVDTIFEIGGQDAKYTFLTNGIASDYAMNEACSAGTGSFLEESAKESLNINYKEIAGIAFNSKNPINFNDQCAAFISSDIKSASHEGLPKEDIVAGLVYSICMNYVNRVKGNRTVGKKVFMQGGVCYNKAIPFAMANLIGKEIIVPPEPGLMGAFGVALEVKKRIELGLLERGEYDLTELIGREFVYKNEFVCAGGSDKCDRKCAISIIEVEGNKYPFGGACSKYYNERLHLKSEPEKYDFVRIRQELVFDTYLNKDIKTGGVKVGISKSFLTNTIFPLYQNFFTKLGAEVILADNIDKEGADKIRTSYCFPAEISHGLFADLLKKNVDYIFMPHVSQMNSNGTDDYSRLCVFVQGEPFVLKSTFGEEIESKFLNPFIDFSLGVEKTEEDFIKIGLEIGKGKKESAEAFRYAYSVYEEMQKEFKEIGKRAIEDLEKENDRFGIVLFGRAYNSYAIEANMNIPHKFASKNVIIIPQDFLNTEESISYENMYWYSGHQILKAARFVAKHPKLFGAFITNYSCGPDSFIIPYFRKIMGKKPSLTLELDSHSADVGIDTRIDAALDIIKNYNELLKHSAVSEVTAKHKGLEVVHKNGVIYIKNHENDLIDIRNEKVEVLIPNMGRFSSRSFAAGFRHFGVHSKAIDVPTFETLKHGRGHSTCKECLPFLLTSGAMIEAVKNKNGEDKLTMFFMIHGYGPCRQGQYFIALKDIIEQYGLKKVGVITMNDEDAFGDFGQDFFLRQWLCMSIADVVHDIESAIRVLAVDRESAMEILEIEWNNIEESLEKADFAGIYKQLEKSSEAFSTIKLKRSLSQAKVISLVGEIYVRRDEFSKSDLVKMLEEKEFVVKTAPITEYVYYTNYLMRKNVVNGLSLKDKISLQIKEKFQHIIEKRVKKIFAKSKLIHYEMIDIDKTINYGKDLISENLIGEAILTTGLAFREILDESCGVISIGPFNCIPSRLADALLNKEMTLDGKYKFGKLSKNGYPKELTNLPFLYVESDGNPFPQITQSKVEIFMMQAEKVHSSLKSKV